MEYLLSILAVVLCILTVMSSTETQNNLPAMARSLLRLLACVMFLAGLSIAFGYVEVPTKYYGFVKLGHQLNYALILEVGAMVLVTLSRK